MDNFIHLTTGRASASRSIARVAVSPKEIAVRKWHRWFSLFFGFFMVWMSVTGLIIHTNHLMGGEPRRGAPPPAPSAPAAPAATAFVCPPDYMCRLKPKDGALPLPVLIQHLHSGEALGPIGTVLSIAAGFALLFFSISGIWLYVQMWRNRASKKLAPRWLWK